MTMIITITINNDNDNNDYGIAYDDDDDNNNCPRRVLAQTAETRGGTLEVPAYQGRNFLRSRKNLDFSRTGLAKDCRNFAGGRINPLHFIKKRGQL